ncbi:NAD-dependent epimerase/dehydratase family protein [Mesobacillus sp. AQ2]|uniref:NAD-dependent epimerase/dehydratase family protein n=1 Tax=unclassified Mesobacillus TaxID=2675270 RepID=UPI00203FE6F8|nr:MULTISPECIES: NAD-dependent epimerase/dehydratase family protein [unclassified Mesobacillus]MCM3124678.1 NAD-dependent epimerase/dehydratase family protein [Mesobacillus sp. MER 33]MCM3234612.1 NAD-dependent epimerase/dehydratase family protein [Mesobacillus sp. MER 48]WHX41552.1 NAD-dependent epimerase/dehydratase family protein [Mesobacillus sp. AQ2]
MAGKTALIAGATGLIGKELLQFLLNGNEYDKVIAIVRRPVGIDHPKLDERIVDFNQLEQRKQLFTADDVFCCLGTTIKKAKTKEAMWKIDVEYPVSIATLASSEGAKKFLLVSSMNADPESAIFYPRMKGKLEEEIKQIPFETTAIFRPSLLLGEREEFRFGERTAAAIFSKLPFLFTGPLRKYKAIEGRTVASAMYRVAQKNDKGLTVYPSELIQEIGC